MSLWVIGSEEVVTIFALAGRGGRAVRGRREVGEALDEVAGMADIRILIVEEGAAEEARERVDALKLAAGGPLVVEVPGIEGPVEGRGTPMDLVRRALGVRI